MRAAAALLAVLLAGGCRSTLDSLGYNQSPSVGTGGASGAVGTGGVAGTAGTAGAGVGAGAGGAAGGTAPETLHPLTKPASYPNPLRDVLKISPSTLITTKIQNVYNQLFHGDPNTQAIYYAVGNQAYILDVLHNQHRTEGQGLGMMFAVQQHQQKDFDPLWRYAKAQLQVTSGPTAGYFNSYCDSADQNSSTMCLDPFGLEQMLTALIFAHDLWGSAGAIDYQKDALALFDLIRHKADETADAGATVTNLFDATTNLPYALPDSTYSGQTRPSIVMPAYYAVWAQATLDPTFGLAAASGRTFLNGVADDSTGLVPARATFAGMPVGGWAVFNPEAYRTQVNMVIDDFWSGGTTFTQELNRLLSFFTSMPGYGTSYSVDGTELNSARETSLIIANAVAAGDSTNGDTTQYLSALWSMPVPTGNSRYFSGIMQLWALMILGGQFQII